MSNFAESFTSRLVQMKIVKEEDRELYTYGFRQGAILIANFAVIFTIGLLFGLLLQSLIFSAAYISLRTVAGGYHARTQRNCNILSILLILAVLSILKWLPWSGVFSLVIMALSIAVVFFLAPVEDENKPLDAIEIKVYRRRSRIVLVILSAVAIFFFILDNTPLLNCFSIAVATSAVMLIAGVVKNKRNQI